MSKRITSGEIIMADIVFFKNKNKKRSIKKGVIKKSRPFSITLLSVFTGVVFAGLFSCAWYSFATAPNPGHNFTEASGGLAQGDLLYGSAVDTLSALAKNATASRYLSNSGASNNPAWAQIDLTNGVTGGLPAANGGTGQAGGYTIGDILYASGATALSKLADVAAGSYLRSGGAGVAPVWSTPTLPNTATNNKLMVGNGTNWVESTPTFPNASATTRKIIVSDGTNWLASTETHAVPGTSGNILTSDGTNWTSVVPTGTILNRQTLTASGTYTPTTGTKNAIVEIWGGGGAGGSCTNVAGCAAGGGGSGGYARYFLTAVTGTYTYTVGAGGTAVAGATGNTGATSTFINGGTTVTANGGLGGTTAAGTAVIKYVAGGAGAGVSTNGNVNSAGTPGESGATSTVVTTGSSGYGGSTALGGGGVGVTNNINATAKPGIAGLANTGSGGSGGITGTTTVAAGGAGGSGIIIITEFR